MNFSCFSRCSGWFLKSLPVINGLNPALIREVSDGTLEEEESDYFVDVLSGFGGTVG